MEQELKCPNCGTAAAAGSAGKIVCSSCGGTFEFVAGEHKLAGVGDFDKLKSDVEDLKAKVAAPPLDSMPPVGPDPGHVGDDGDEDDEIEDDEDDDEDL